jgi:YfiH family protein
LKPFKKHNLQRVQTPSKRLIGFKPNWPAPEFVQALMTTREGGVSEAPWNSLNLGDHVGDNPEHVQANRALVAQAMQAPAIYLRQVHGVKGVAIDLHTPDHTEADVAWTSETGVACTMMVADCLPILVCHPHQKWVAAAHAGWRGLAGENGHGVVETLAATARLQGCLPKDCLVWLGPCIGPTAFEVGPEVLTAFENQIPRRPAKPFLCLLRRANSWLIWQVWPNIACNWLVFRICMAMTAAYLGVPTSKLANTTLIGETQHCWAVQGEWPLTSGLRLRRYRFRLSFVTVL